jgi:succinate dehydrogenase / fumarate reductase, cytochrome b subunit
MAVEYRARSLGTALRYKGREGMWTWILHRATGLGVLFFLVVHVIDTGIIIYRPDWYDHALEIYRHPLFRIAELFVFFGVVYHAANGLRIIVQDFWSYVMQRQRQLSLAVAVIVAVAMVPITWIMVAPLLGWSEEPGVERHEERCLADPTAPACVGEAAAAPAEVTL